MGIISISTAVAMDASGNECKRTVCVDERGQAWEILGKKWSPLPALPNCTCGHSVQNPSCEYHKAART